MLGRYEENAYVMRMVKVSGHEDTALLELKDYGHGITTSCLPARAEGNAKNSQRAAAVNTSPTTITNKYRIFVCSRAQPC